MARRGRSLSPSTGSTFTTVSPAAKKGSGRPESVTRSCTPRRSASRRAATFHGFIKHVLHVKSASGDFQAKTPKHPISHDTLPHLVTQRAILMVCASCVTHTTGDSSPSGGLTPAHVLPKPSQSSLTYVGSVWNGPFLVCLERLGVPETRFLRAALAPGRWVSPDPASPPEPAPGPGLALLMCVHHDEGGSYAILFVVITAFWQQVDCQTSRSAPGPAEQLAGYLGSCCRGSRRPPSSTRC